MVHTVLSAFQNDKSLQYNMHNLFLSHHGNTPILLNFPHSGRYYPEEYLKLMNCHVDDLRVFEDPYLDIILPDTKKIDTHLFVNQLARAFIDVNRSKENSLFPYLNGEATGLVPYVFPNGQGIYKNRLHDIHIEKRIAHIYDPYHHQLGMMVKNIHQKFGQVLLIDCHSMPSFGDKSDPDAYKTRPDIIIGDNFGHSIDAEIVDKIENIFISHQLSVFRNFPYAGGYITSKYSCRSQKINTVQIEINRSCYIDEKTLIVKEESKKMGYIFCQMLEVVNSYLQKSL